MKHISEIAIFEPVIFVRLEVAVILHEDLLRTKITGNKLGMKIVMFLILIGH